MLEIAVTAALLTLLELKADEPAGELFPTSPPRSGWIQFQASGYAAPVCGTIYRTGDPVSNGMPLGAIDTGCIDLETDGTFGYSTIFNTHVPARGGAAVRAPVLALSSGGQTWALGVDRAGGRIPGSSPLPRQTAWLPADLGPEQPAWAAGASGIPGWARSAGGSKHDLPRGRIFCHGPAVLRWNSPIEGEVEFRGGLWSVRNLGRVQKWSLRRNGKSFAAGKIAWGPTSSAPQSFAAGDGGSIGSPLKLAVRPGDQIELALKPAGGDSDFAGVDLTIAAPALGKSWDLAADWSDAQNPNGPWTYDHGKRPLYLLEPGRLPRVQRAREIHYWGHYPIADLEFETSAPVQVGLRAWTSFIPGALLDSLIPGIVFETHLRNRSGLPRTGTILFNFPGPSPEEAGGGPVEREPLQGGLKGMAVKAPLASYALVASGGEAVRTGGELGEDEKAWLEIGRALPEPRPDQLGTSVAADFSLAAGQESAVRFILAWCAPEWRAGGSPAAADSRAFTHMYARHYPRAVETAKLLADRQEALLRRIIAWQQVIYSDGSLPFWLKDALINNLYMIAETGLWAQAKAPLGSWCRPEDGLFGMIECPRECPQVECIPCSLYGNLPLVYFFPELALSTLRGYKNYQWPDGMVVWIFGPMADFAAPARPYQVASSDVCMVEMIDKLWLRTGDDRVLKEFYEPARRATIHAMNLRPEYGEKQVISMPAGDQDNEWFEFVPLRGLVSHVGGLHLAQLRIMGRMAEAAGDPDFARQCGQWFAAGSKAMEEDLWAGTHYLLYKEILGGKVSDVVLGFQLDGEWISRFHGLAGVFRPDRVATALGTIARVNADPQRFPYGAKVFASTDGRPIEGELSYWRNTGTHAPSCFMLGMTYILEGQRGFGLNLIRRVLEYVIHRGYTWDFPLVWDVESGVRYYGSDYYQNLMLWSVPAVLAGQDLSGPCKPGGLVDRLLKAARK